MLSVLAAVLRMHSWCALKINGTFCILRCMIMCVCASRSVLLCHVSKFLALSPFDLCMYMSLCVCVRIRGISLQQFGMVYILVSYHSGQMTTIVEEQVILDSDEETVAVPGHAAVPVMGGQDTLPYIPDTQMVASILTTEELNFMRDGIDEIVTKQPIARTENHIEEPTAATPIEETMESQLEEMIATIDRIEEPIATTENQPFPSSERPIEEPITTSENSIEEPITTTENPIEEPITTTENPIEEPITTTENPIEEPITTTENPIEEPAGASSSACASAVPDAVHVDASNEFMELSPPSKAYM